MYRVCIIEHECQTSNIVLKMLQGKSQSQQTESGTNRATDHRTIQGGADENRLRIRLQCMFTGEIPLFSVEYVQDICRLINEILCRK